MLQQIVLNFVLFYISFVHAESISGCQLNLNQDLPKQKDPVYLVKGPGNTLLLAMPESGSITLTKQQALTLACTGGRNTLVNSGRETTTVSCVEGQTLQLGSQGVRSLDLVCNLRSAASLLITKTPCVSRSVIIQSSFQVGNSWFPLIESCHDIDQSNTYWSRHILYGPEIPGKVIQNSRPGFSRGNSSLYKGFNPDESYSWKHQEIMFEKIYGKEKASQYLNQRSNLYLARGHLSPHADFLFSSWQLLTYFFVNAAPQWQSINAGNWQVVENNARRLATTLRVNLLDITGTYGQLNLADDKGIMRPASLEGNNKLPVPEYLWKLLAEPKNGSCIVFISTNNPHLTSLPTPLCTDVCSTAGWPPFQKDFKKGYVYCCEYRNFNIPSKPPVDCKSILKFK